MQIRQRLQQLVDDVLLVHIFQQIRPDDRVEVRLHVPARRKEPPSLCARGRRWDSLLKHRKFERRSEPGVASPPRDCDAAARSKTKYTSRPCLDRITCRSWTTLTWPRSFNRYETSRYLRGAPPTLCVVGCTNAGMSARIPRNARARDAVTAAYPRARDTDSAAYPRGGRGGAATRLLSKAAAAPRRPVFSGITGET